MKKLIIALILLVIVGGVAFYFGWIQIHLPENTYAVIFTKTGGWDEEVTHPGTFVWRWERLIPTNLSMHKFTLEPYTARVSSKGTLPNGDAYSQVMDPRPDFGYSLELAVDFQINPESLPKLVEDSLLTQETFSEWHSDTSEVISARAAGFAREQSTRSDFAASLTALGDEFSESLAAHLRTGLPYVEIQNVTIRRIEVPDFDLYIAAKQIYLDLAQSRKESYEAALLEISWTEARSEQHFEVIRQYGELITQYPALLDLFELKDGALGTILDEIDAFTAPPASE